MPGEPAVVLIRSPVPRGMTDYLVDLATWHGDTELARAAWLVFLHARDQEEKAVLDLCSGDRMLAYELLRAMRPFPPAPPHGR
jgi:hypothetical protein